MDITMKTLHLSLLSLSTLLAGAALGAAHERDTFIQQYDTNRDGKVERSEFDAARAERFNATDTDHSNALDQGEYLVEYLAQLDAGLATSSKSEADKTATRQRQLRQTLVRFNALDADHGKDISKAEYDASGNRSFGNHDSDKDGTITSKDAVNDSPNRQAARE